MTGDADFTIEMQERCVLVKVGGDPKNTDVLTTIRERLLAQASEAGDRPVVIDLSALSLLQSLMLGDLVQIKNALRGRRLMLAGMKPDVRRVFALTKLDKLFEIHESVGKALAHLEAIK